MMQKNSKESKIKDYENENVGLLALYPSTRTFPYVSNKITLFNSIQFTRIFLILVFSLTPWHMVPFVLA